MRTKEMQDKRTPNGETQIKTSGYWLERFQKGRWSPGPIILQAGLFGKVGKRSPSHCVVYNGSSITAIRK